MNTAASESLWIQPSAGTSADLHIYLPSPPPSPQRTRKGQNTVSTTGTRPRSSKARSTKTNYTPAKSSPSATSPVSFRSSTFSFTHEGVEQIQCMCPRNSAQFLNFLTKLSPFFASRSLFIDALTYAPSEMPQPHDILNHRARDLLCGLPPACTISHPLYHRSSVPDSPQSSVRIARDRRHARALGGRSRTGGTVTGIASTSACPLTRSRARTVSVWQRRHTSRGLCAHPIVVSAVGFRDSGNGESYNAYAAGLGRCLCQSSV